MLPSSSVISSIRGSLRRVSAEREPAWVDWRIFCRCEAFRQNNAVSEPLKNPLMTSMTGSRQIRTTTVTSFGGVDAAPRMDSRLMISGTSPQSLRFYSLIMGPVEPESSSPAIDDLISVSAMTFFMR